MEGAQPNDWNGIAAQCGEKGLQCSRTPKSLTSIRSVFGVLKSSFSDSRRNQPEYTILRESSYRKRFVRPKILEALTGDSLILDCEIV